MIDVKIGDIIPMTHFQLWTPTFHASYKAPKNQLFCFHLLGTEPKDQSKPIDFVEVMKQLGWQPIDEKLRTDLSLR